MKEIISSKMSDQKNKMPFKTPGPPEKRTEIDAETLALTVNQDGFNLSQGNIRYKQGADELAYDHTGKVVDVANYFIKDAISHIHGPSVFSGNDASE